MRSGLQHPLLASLGVEHAFGTRADPVREDVVRPVQVHGVTVARVLGGQRAQPTQADAIVSDQPGQAVGVVTADCVPLLAAGPEGRGVAAIHAGWRGLAQGVIESGLRALSKQAGAHPEGVVFGPHIGSCCYEVDEPVLAALEARFGAAAVDRATKASRPDHSMLSLASLVEAELDALGVARSRWGRVAGCTQCQPRDFHSYRRDGERAGRLQHFIRTCG